MVGRYARRRIMMRRKGCRIWRTIAQEYSKFQITLPQMYSTTNYTNSVHLIVFIIISFFFLWRQNYTHNKKDYNTQIEIRVSEWM